MIDKKENFEEILERFNDNPKNFIYLEALKLFYESMDYVVKIEALKLLEKTAQLF